MKKQIALVAASFAAVVLLAACSSDNDDTAASSSTTTDSSTVVSSDSTVSSSSHAGTYQNGEYRAEAAEYSNGYKEYVAITIADGKISKAEFNAVNESGDLKTDDEDYKENMEAQSGTYPEEYMKKLAEELVDKQSTEGVEAVTGATHSSSDFKILADAAIANAEKGDTTTAIVELGTE